MKVIRKKISPKYFGDVRNRNKNFELIKDEDNIQVGDKVVLCEYSSGWHTVGDKTVLCEADSGWYTGRKSIRIVKYVLRDVPEYGLMNGYCIIGW